MSKDGSDAPAPTFVFDERKIAQSFTSRSYFKPCARQLSEDNRCIRSAAVNCAGDVTVPRPALNQSVSCLDESDSFLLEFDWIETEHDEVSTSFCQSYFTAVGDFYCTYS